MNSTLQIEHFEKTGIDYGQPETPFVSHYGHFCLHFAHKQLGLGRVGLRANPFVYRFLDPCARLEVLGEGGCWHSVRRLELQSLPWMVVERASVGNLEIRARHVFYSGSQIVSEFTFCNLGETSLSHSLRWRGFLPAHEATEERWLSPFGGLQPEGFATWMEPIHSGCRGGWRTQREVTSYPQPSFGLAVSGAEVHTHIWEPHLSGSRLWGDGGCGIAAGFALQTTAPVDLPPGQTVTVFLSFHLAWNTAVPETAAVTVKSFDDAVEAARGWYHQEIGAGIQPGTECPFVRQQIWRARHALIRTGFQAETGEFGGRRASLCTSDDQFFSTLFFWDSLFSSAAIASFNPGFARETILAAFTRQDPRDGSCPENKWNFTVPERLIRQYPQAPVGSWAVRHYLELHPEDAAFLAEVYPLLRNNHRYWDEFGDADRDGLAEWNWTGQTADDSPLYDAFAPGGRVLGCQWIPPIASVQLNCFLYKDAGLLGEFAGSLGKVEDVEYFRRRQETIQTKLQEICWVPSERRFWDYSHATRAHSRVPTFYLFWPLFAGLPVEEGVVQSLLEEELLNPERFFGSIPFPSVAYNHPKFDPSGYWRGKAWPHISYWLLETLVRVGRKQEADVAADRILAWLEAQNGFRENFETDPRLLTATGHADYNWGIAAYSLMAEKRYQHFVP